MYHDIFFLSHKFFSMFSLCLLLFVPQWSMKGILNGYRYHFKMIFCCCSQESIPFNVFIIEGRGPSEEYGPYLRK